MATGLEGTHGGGTDACRPVLDLSPDGILVLDGRGRIVDVNLTALGLLGCTREQAVSAHLQRFSVGDAPFDLARGREVMAPVDAGQAVRTEWRARRWDGSPFWVEACLRPVALAGHSRIVAFLRDIEDRKGAEGDLREARDAAEAATRTKSEFLANMSHEIRTPLNAIVGMTRLTLDSTLNEEQRENVTIIKEAADALLGLVNDVLDFSKAEAKRVELESLPFDLRAAVDHALDTLAIRAHEKGLELVSLVDAEVPTRVVGDPGRLRQVLVNLLSNAVKFTDRGEVALEVRCTADEGDQVMLRFEVADTGIGIPPDQTGRIFEAFAQGDGSIRRRYGGTGLGLAISRQIVERMGGEIGLQSEPGKGSTFWFTAPFRRQGPSLEASASPPPDLRGMRVLVADDTPSNRFVLSRILTQWGCRAEAVPDGKEALEALTRAQASDDPYKVLLLDMLMEGWDGEETARRVKSDPALSGTPILVLTSLGRRGDARRLQEIGVDGYLLKPVKQTQLLDAVCQAVSPQEDNSGMRPLITRHTIAERSFDGLHVLLVEDKPLNQKVATRFLQRRGLRVTVADNGRVALEHLRDQRVDLVLMDVQMPEMDGLQATRAIRVEEATTGRPRVPIVAMTAHALDGDRERCLDSGMDDYVTKPVLEDDLFAVLGRWMPLPEPRGTRQIRAPFDAVSAELEALQARFGDDPAFLSEISSLFLEDTPRDLRALEEAVGKADGERVVSLAHGLKGTTRTFGVDGLAVLFQHIEAAGRSRHFQEAREGTARARALYDSVDRALRRMLSQTGATT